MIDVVLHTKSVSEHFLSTHAYRDGQVSYLNGWWNTRLLNL